MLELPHTVVGATIAAKVGNPALALPLSLASHFVLDLLPHWNPHLNTEIKNHGKVTNKTTLFIAGDVLVSLIVGLYIASLSLPNSAAFITVVAGAFMGVLPDAVEAPYFFLRVRYPFVERLIKFQKSIQNDAHPIIGLSTQVLVLAGCFWWILQ